MPRKYRLFNLQQKVDDDKGGTLSFTPTSVWNISGHKGLEQLKGIVDDEFYNPALRKKGKGAAGVGRGHKLSEFSPLLAARILEYWSEKEDLVLDPFAGRGTRVLMAKYMERRSIAVDISNEFITHINSKIKKPQTLLDYDEDNLKYIPSVIHGDSRYLSIKDESIDFIYSCPPFWCIEQYEHCNGQLADIDDYQKFIRELEVVFSECWRVLKKDKFCAMVVQDFRLEGKFYAFGSHTVEILERAGFKMHDIVIRTYTTNIPVKVNDAKKKKYTVKIHEYIIVVKKIHEL